MSTLLHEYVLREEWSRREQELVSRSARNRERLKARSALRAALYRRRERGQGEGGLSLP